MSKGFSYNSQAILSQTKAEDLGCFNYVTKGLKVGNLNSYENKFLSTHRRHGFLMSFDVKPVW